jgi:hypothetical protein
LAGDGSCVTREASGQRTSAAKRTEDLNIAGIQFLSFLVKSQVTSVLYPEGSSHEFSGKAMARRPVSRKAVPATSTPQSFRAMSQVRVSDFGTWEQRVILLGYVG